MLRKWLLVASGVLVVLNVLKSRIDSSDFDGALRQAFGFRQQLEEIIGIVSTGSASAGQGQ